MLAGVVDLSAATHSLYRQAPEVLRFLTQTTKQRNVPTLEKNEGYNTGRIVSATKTSRRARAATRLARRSTSWGTTSRATSGMKGSSSCGSIVAPSLRVDTVHIFEHPGICRGACDMLRNHGQGLTVGDVLPVLSLEQATMPGMR